MLLVPLSACSSRIVPGRIAIAGEGTGRYQPRQAKTPYTLPTHRQGPGSAGALTQVVQIAYYLFGKIADKRKLLKDEADEPLSEIAEHKA